MIQKTNFFIKHTLQRNYFISNSIFHKYNYQLFIVKMKNIAFMALAIVGFTTDVKSSHHSKRAHHTEVRTTQTQDNEYWEKDPLCAKWNGSRCIRCAQKSYFDDGKCKASDPQCKTFCKDDGACTSCWPGYDLSNGKCVVCESPYIDPLCHTFSQGKCTQCSQRAYFNKDGACVNVNPLCKTFAPSDGCCTTCYPGYQVRSGTCVVDKDWKGWKKSEDDDKRKSDSDKDWKGWKKYSDDDDKKKSDNDQKGDDQNRDETSQVKVQSRLNNRRQNNDQNEQDQGEWRRNDEWDQEQQRIPNERWSEWNGQAKRTVHH